MSLQDDELSALIQSKARYHRASEALHADVRARVALAAAAAQEAPKPERRRSWRGVFTQWTQAAGGFAVGVALTLMVSPLIVQWAQTWRQPGDADLVAEHVRSLQAGPLIQVASSDRHTVKPWFQGKIDFAPTVLDLADAGFPLTGGRIEQVGRERMAVLVYAHRRHVLNLFVWPEREATPAQQPSQQQYRGFNLLYWHDGQMRYGLVSDMDAHEVANFQQAWRAHRLQP
ncbi:MAG: anti-sigma factor [Aquabacterium sp.]